jgi:TP901 family phage tail tape measure protein
MAERLAYLEAVVGADITQFRKGMRDIRNEVGILSETMSGLSAIGRTMTFAFTTPVVTLGTYAVQAAAGFEEAMRNVNSIAQLSDEEFQNLSATVLDFGKNTRAGATDAAGALYTAYSAGITETATALEFMEISSQTAEAGLAGLEETTEALVASFLSFGADALPVAQQLETVQKHADALTQMVQIGVGSMSAFANAVGQVIPTAVTLDVEINELYGSMAYLTQRGLSASKASTSLNSALTALLKPSEAMKGAFRELGVATGDELIEKFGGFEGALTALVGTTDGTATELNQLFKDIRAFRAIGLLTSDMEGWSQALEDFNEGVEGATGRAHAEQMKSFAAQWDLMTSAMEGAAIAIGNVLLPVLTPLINGVTEFMHTVSDTNPELMALIVGATGVAAAVFPLIWLFSAIATPIGAITIGLGTLATAFALNFGGIRETVSQAVEDIFGDLSGLQSIIDTAMSIIFPPDTGSYVESSIPNPVALSTTDFITVEAGDSLWQIWYDKYKDDFTFEAFMEATGLEDGVVIHPGDIITISRGDTAGMWGQLGAQVGNGLRNTLIKNPTAVRLAEILHIDLGAYEEAQKADLLTRLGMAFEAVKGQIGTELQGVLESARAWFDTKVGEGLNWFASLFQGGSGSGDTPVYNAIKELLELDLYGAINAIIPEAGDHLRNALGGDWGAKIGEAFPQISAGLGTLFSNFGNWLITEGVPTISRSVGFLIGRFGTILSTGISSVWSSITSGGGTEGVSSALQGFGESVVQPFIAGFHDGMGDEAKAADSPIQTLFEAFSGAVLLGAGVTGLGSLLKGQGLGTAIQTSFNFALRGFSWAFSPIANALMGALNTTLSQAAGRQITLAGLANTLRGKIAGAMATVASYAIPVAIGFTIGWEIYWNNQEFFESIATAIFGGSGNRQAFLQDFERRVYDILGMPGGYHSMPLHVQLAAEADVAVEAVNKAFEEADSGDGVLVRFNAKFMPENLDALPDDIFNTLVEQYGMANPTFLLPTSIKPDFSLTEGESVALATWWEEYRTRMAGMGMDLPPLETAFNLTLLPDIEVGSSTSGGDDIQTGIAKAWSRQMLANDAQSTWTLAEDIAGKVGEVSSDPTVTGAITTTAGEMTTQMSSAMNAAVNETGVIDPQAFANSFLIPIETEWLKYFGETGSLTQAVVTFAGTFGDEIDAINTDIVELKTGVNTELPAITETIQTEGDLMISQMSSITFAVDTLSMAFNDLYEAATKALGAANINGIGGEDGDPLTPRADGGDVMQGQSYMVGERGAEMFVPRQSGFIIPNEVLTGVSKGGGGSITNQTVIINEAFDVDRMLYELRRRGIKL